jgi:hypothetical protein
MTEPVFPEDSWVEVHYPLTSEQKNADRDVWPSLPGWVVAQCGRDGWEICVQAPELATCTSARPRIRCASGTPPRSACPKHRPTWNGLPGLNWRRNERHLERTRPRSDHSIRTSLRLRTRPETERARIVSCLLERGNRC